jgi:hypothetical protein
MVVGEDVAALSACSVASSLFRAWLFEAVLVGRSHCVCLVSLL